MKTKKAIDDTYYSVQVGSEGWWFVRLVSTGDEGWAPASYLERCPSRAASLSSNGGETFHLLYMKAKGDHTYSFYTQLYSCDLIFLIHSSYPSPWWSSIVIAKSQEQCQVITRKGTFV